MNERIQTIRVLHFMNPFFAGRGGEEANHRGPEVAAGSRGPGRKIDELLGAEGQVVATAVCGDNYFQDHEDAALNAICQAAREARADLVIAGPAFNAGRYGLACGAVCKAVQERLGIAAATSMSPENPGSVYRKQRVYIAPSGDSARTMGEVLPRLVRLGLRLARRKQLEPAASEGYLPTGIRYNQRLSKTSAQRAVNMLLAKMAGRPFETEIRLEEQDRVVAPAPIASLNEAVVAIVTETGFIPHGNPDRIPSARSKVWGRYSIAHVDDLTAAQFMFIHGGYDTRKADEDPDRAIPVDALRMLEREGKIKRTLDEVLSTCGNGGSLNEMKRIGVEMATELKRQGATAAIVPST